MSARQGSIELPGYTHMQQAMPSSVALWAGGFAAELRDDAEGLRQCQRRLDKNPLGSAAGYGVANVPLDRERTRAALGFAEVQQPVTAVQLSRGKAEAQLRVRDRARDAGHRPSRRRPAAVLYAGVFVRRAAGRVHDRLFDHAAEAQPGCVRADSRSHGDRRRSAAAKCSASSRSSRPAISAICS